MILKKLKILRKYRQDIKEISIENLTVTRINKITYQDLDGIFKDFLTLIRSYMHYKIIILFRIKVLPCDLNPNQCQNGGSCANDMKGGFKCTCENGYTGEKCETGKFKFS
jgi:hypothetical protein